MSETDRQGEKIYSFEPLTLGEVIDRTIRVFIDNIKVYLMISGAFIGPAIVLMILMSLVFFPNRAPMSHPDPVAMMGFSVVVLATILFYSCGIFFLMGAVIFFTSKRILGEKSTFGEAVKYTSDKFWLLVSTSVTVFLYIAGISLLAFVLFMPIFAFLMSLKMVILVVLFAILFWLITLYFWGMYALGFHAAVIEEIYNGEAVKRSAALFNSSRDAKIKIIALPVLIGILTAIVTAIPYLGYLISIILLPLTYIGLTIVYYDIRFRTEGLDIELAAERITGSEPETAE